MIRILTLLTFSLLTVACTTANSNTDSNTYSNGEFNTESNTKLYIKSHANSKNNFRMFDKCSDDGCVIYMQNQGKVSVYDDDIPRSYSLDKVNDKLYHITYSCGSPCHNNVFINDKQEEDWTDTLIKRQDNCLIEYDIKDKKFTARQIFSKKAKTILTLNKLAFESSVPIWFYSEHSSFDNDVFRIEITEKEDSNVVYKIKNPCGVL